MHPALPPFAMRRIFSAYLGSRSNIDLAPKVSRSYSLKHYGTNRNASLCSPYVIIRLFCHSQRQANAGDQTGKPLPFL